MFRSSPMTKLSRTAVRRAALLSTRRYQDTIWAPLSSPHTLALFILVGFGDLDHAALFSDLYFYREKISALTPLIDFHCRRHPSTAQRAKERTSGDLERAQGGNTVPLVVTSYQ